MKNNLPLLLFILVLFSCNSSGDSVVAATDTEVLKDQKFFPVTSYIKGEIYTIRSSGINPIKYTTVNGRTDSVWLNLEDLDAAVQEFLHPQIDSTNLITLFTEKSFLDQSINAVTLTYDPSGTLPDSLKLIHWDVYFDPENSSVKRIYIVKQVSKTELLQLTWINKQWCKITRIKTDEKGISRIEKEEKLVWDF